MGMPLMNILLKILRKKPKFSIKNIEISKKTLKNPSKPQKFIKLHRIYRKQRPIANVDYFTMKDQWKMLGLEKNNIMRVWKNQKHIPILDTKDF